MNIVSYTSSIRSIIIISKYTKFLQLTNSYLCDIWHKVIGDTIWILSNCSTLMCANWIKVTKNHNIPFWICFLDIGKHLLQHGFCPAVRVRTLSLWAFFCNRNLCRISIYSCGGRENNIFHIMFSHYINQS